jgi:hypothetical protein
MTTRQPSLAPTRFLRHVAPLVLSAAPRGYWSEPHASLAFRNIAVRHDAETSIGRREHMFAFDLAALMLYKDVCR